MDDLTAIRKANQALAAAYLDQRDRFCAALEADAAPEHEHYTKTREGAVVWSIKDECIVCGTGTDSR